MNLSQVEAVLFDLDGTVIDSYPGIQKAFDNAYLKLYSVTNQTSIKDFIGPPMPLILARVNGETDNNKIERFVKLFKDSYDAEDFKLSVLYKGMKELLEDLYNRGIKLFLVTNKRQKPTELITKYLNIEHYFCALYCIDSNKGYPSKGEMVKDILEVERLSSNKCVLIGDTYQDEISAKPNNITFIYAAYGYGSLSNVDRSISQPLETLKFINNI
ncbi:MAG TPA: HAD hydrolase-like protein [Segetibacter sp.]